MKFVQLTFYCILISDYLYLYFINIFKKVVTQEVATIKINRTFFTFICLYIYGTHYRYIKILWYRIYVMC
jgi:hypothetical protein